MNNPFSMVFGKEPSAMILRIDQTNQILESISSTNPAYQAYMITGVRGSGKTVMLTNIIHLLAKQPDWIIIELNPERDMLQSMVSKLCADEELYKLFQRARINLSLFGLGIEIEGKTPETDVEVTLIKMLESIKKQGKKVLIAIDEVSNNEYMRVFASSFQMFVRHDLPVFMVMTGLYENVDDLQNEKTLTFLYRAPKVIMTPLNFGAITAQYEKTLKVDRPTAIEMARLTMGYPLAFQLLGYLCFENGGDYRDQIPEYRQSLEDLVYIKIWSELSRKDKQVSHAIARSKDGKISDIRDTLKCSSNEFNPYRDRLIKKGIINGDERGYVRFTLPLFAEFVNETYEFAD